MLAVCGGLAYVLAADCRRRAWRQRRAARRLRPPRAICDRQYDEAFQEMLRQPADLDVLFRFAAVASQTGDLEGAISALERMLLINPNLPRVRLELGVLYYRLGSYEVARTYLEGALKSPTMPRRRAQPAPSSSSRRSTNQQKRVALQRRGVPRLALPVERQSRPGHLERAAVRPGRQPQPGGGRRAPTGASSARCRCATPTTSAPRTRRRWRRISPATPTASSSSRPPTSRCST